MPPKSRLLAALSGLMLAAACPPLNLFPLAWIGLMPLFLALEQTRDSGFKEGIVAGLIFNGVILHWFAFNSGTHVWVALITLFAAMGVLSLFWGLAAWLFNRLKERLGNAAWFILPFSWTAWEGWQGNLAEVAFPWPILALTQAGFDPVLQVMEFTGIWGVTFWVAALNTALYVLWRNPLLEVRRLGFAALIALAAVPIFASMHSRVHAFDQSRQVNLAVVQGSVAAEEKWLKGIRHSWTIYDSLTRIAAEEPRVDLVVWPETALPAHLLHQSVYADRLANLSDRLETPIVTGASDYNIEQDKRLPLNACMMVEPKKWISDRGAKRKLVPFGERVPFQWIVPQLGTLNLGQAEFLPGRYQALFTVPLEDGYEMKFPVMICYESIFPGQSREAVIDGANLLVTISNDAWYGPSFEAQEIMALSRFRSIETRRSMARASNSGISFICDPLGRIIKRTNLLEPAWAKANVPLNEGTTFYVRHGDWFLLLVTGIYGLGLVTASFVKGIRYV